MADSFGMWKKMEREAGVTLLRPHPMLAVGEDQSIMTKLATSVRKGGSEPILLSAGDVNRKYGTNFPAHCHGLIDPSAGVLMADKCVQTLQRLFREAGGRVVDEWPVQEVEMKPHGEVELRGPKGSVRTARIVMCPGPWAGPLLAKIGVHLPLQVRRISVFYWRIKEEDTPTISFVDTREFDDGHNYGVPLLEYPGMMKLVHHTGPVIESPDERDKIAASTQHRESMKQYVKDNFPTLDPEPVVEETCLYTCTPDLEFVVDRHPRHPNVIFACGFSGTGFKIAPAIGEDLCNLALGRPTVRDLSVFSADRFKAKSKM
ncbi:peroxisomal sarcosine oxidase-like isoform X1 [Portunus trituberculatus]|nr:peroxisomal sarcosine oxidase-like isoform X1 [Portunus trituberculatus]